MASATVKGARRGAEGGPDEQLVRVLEETAMHKILEKLEEPLQKVVHEAVSEAIVHAVHAEPASVSVSRRRGHKSTEVKRPKAGGRCEAVWKELDRISARRSAPPTLADIQKVGERRSWNPNNTRVEYYQWRKAHGISGRLASASGSAQVASAAA